MGILGIGSEVLFSYIKYNCALIIGCLGLFLIINKLDIFEYV